MGVPPYPPYPATTIAAWFISQAKAGQVEPSGLQLHKLVGRAQGHYRARYGRPLLAEPMPAWPPGRPVAPDGHAVAAAGVSPAGPGNDGAPPGTAWTLLPPASSARSGTATAAASPR
jgi:hypothetical protein